MEKKQRPRPPVGGRKIGYDPQSFDVTCVVGTVQLGAGDVPPHVAAFQLIAEHDAPGTYEFPLVSGDNCRVTVEHN